jgi:methylmalonyl-CoA mutase cobalamin-binding subunit
MFIQMEVDAHDIGNKLVTSIICDYGVEKTTQQ